MKLAAVTLAVFSATGFTFAPARADTVGHVNFFLGQKSLNSGDWEPLEKQAEIGAVMSFGQDKWPVFIAVDVFTSADDTTVYDPFLGNVKLTASTFEIDPGVRKIWKKGRVLPYIGGGLGIIGAGIQGDTAFVDADASDVTFGLWADAGVFFRLGGHFNLGVDLRYSSANVDLDFGDGTVARDISAGGFSYGLLLGFGW